MTSVVLCSRCEAWVAATHAAGVARSRRLVAARLYCRAYHQPARQEPTPPLQRARAEAAA